MTIWKYPLKLTDYQQITIPQGAQPLSVMVQNGIPCLWILLDHRNPPESVLVRIYGTGYEVAGDPGRHCGSFQLEGGDLVFHVFFPVT
jgi:hypothetical protein